MKKYLLSALLLSAAPFAAHAYNLNPIVGMSIGDKQAQQNPEMQQVIAKAMAYLTPAQQAQVKQFLPMGTSSSINAIHNVYYINACESGLCDVNNIVIAATQDWHGQTENKVWVLLTLNGKTTIYGQPWETVLQTMKNPNKN